ncbi:MAG: hypothetical protein H6Q07_3452 [Acidobacteria bacterium]|nr:hypothetical protein [Acidobacteriota bacterium]
MELIDSEDSLPQPEIAVKGVQVLINVFNQIMINGRWNIVAVQSTLKG